MHKANHQLLQIHVTGRHLSVTDPIKDYAQKKIENIGLDFPRILDAHVILDVEKHRQTAEVILHCGNHIVIEAKAESDDLYASIDEVVAKATRQLRKAKTKIQRHQPRTLEAYEVDLHVLQPLAEEHEEHAEPEVVMTEKFAVKPMFVDEHRFDRKFFSHDHLRLRVFFMFLGQWLKHVEIDLIGFERAWLVPLDFGFCLSQLTRRLRHNLEAYEVDL